MSEDEAGDVNAGRRRTRARERRREGYVPSEEIRRYFPPSRRKREDDGSPSTTYSSTARRNLETLSGESSAHQSSKWRSSYCSARIYSKGAPKSLLQSFPSGLRVNSIDRQFDSTKERSYINLRIDLPCEDFDDTGSRMYIFEQLLLWLRDLPRDQTVEFRFPPQLSKEERKWIHRASDSHGLSTTSSGFGDKRYITAANHPFDSITHSDEATILRAEEVWKACQYDGSEELLNISFGEIKQLVSLDKPLPLHLQSAVNAYSGKLRRQKDYFEACKEGRADEIRRLASGDSSLLWMRDAVSGDLGIHIASRSRHLQALRVLVELKSPLHLTDRRLGKTPLELCEKARFREGVAILSGKNADQTCSTFSWAGEGGEEIWSDGVCNEWINWNICAVIETNSASKGFTHRQVTHQHCNDRTLMNERQAIFMAHLDTS